MLKGETVQWLLFDVLDNMRNFFRPIGVFRKLSIYTLLSLNVHHDGDRNFVRLQIKLESGREGRL